MPRHYTKPSSLPSWDLSLGQEGGGVDTRERVSAWLYPWGRPHRIAWHKRARVHPTLVQTSISQVMSWASIRRLDRTPHPSFVHDQSGSSLIFVGFRDRSGNSLIFVETRSQAFVFTADRGLDPQNGGINPATTWPSPGRQHLWTGDAHGTRPPTSSAVFVLHPQPMPAER